MPDLEMRFHCILLCGMGLHSATSVKNLLAESTRTHLFIHPSIHPSISEASTPKLNTKQSLQHILSPSQFQKLEGSAP
jgi:hypothetical protein